MGLQFESKPVFSEKTGFSSSPTGVRLHRQMLDLAVVIVNYNTCEYLRECLRSLYASEGPVIFAVAVVDNASADGSAAMVRSEFPQASLVESSINGGYAYANNLGLRHFGFGVSAVGDKEGQVDNLPYDGDQVPRYALMLNPDTVLPPKALADMMAFMDTHPEAGVAGPRLVRQDGSLDLACRRSFPSPAVSFYRMTGLSRLFPRSRRFGRYNLTYLNPDEVEEVDSVVGAFMLIRREAIAQAGLLDERFFMYGEDLDLCYRIKQQGWKVLYNPAATVLHVKGAASKQCSYSSIIAFYQAMYLFHNKHYKRHTFFLINWFIVLGIVLMGGLALVRNFLRPEGRKGVASAA
jgi:N-acetylglucosaminyl-diphospho-decaprenol L-rhamnosyltransferase